MSQMPQQQFGQYSTVPKPQATQEIPNQQPAQQMPQQQVPQQQVQQPTQQIPQQSTQQIPQQSTQQIPQQPTQQVAHLDNPVPIPPEEYAVAQQHQQGLEPQQPLQQVQQPRQLPQQVPQQSGGQFLPQSPQPTQQFASTAGQVQPGSSYLPQPAGQGEQPTQQSTFTSLSQPEMSPLSRPSFSSVQPSPSTVGEPQPSAQPQGAGQMLAPQVETQQQATQSPDGQQVATALQDLERTLDQANVYALENGQPIVARITEELDEIAETERKLILRQSPFAESLRQPVAATLQQGVQQLQQQPDDAALQEVLATTQQAVASLQNAVLQTPDTAQAGAQGQQRPNSTPQN